MIYVIGLIPPPYPPPHTRDGKETFDMFPKVHLWLLNCYCTPSYIDQLFDDPIHSRKAALRRNPHIQKPEMKVQIWNESQKLTGTLCSYSALTEEINKNLEFLLSHADRKSELHQVVYLSLSSNNLFFTDKIPFIRDEIHLVPSAGTNLSWNSPETALRPDEFWECFAPVDLLPNIFRNLFIELFIWPHVSSTPFQRGWSRSRSSFTCVVWSENFIYSFSVLIQKINSRRGVNWSGLRGELRWMHGFHPTTPPRG